MKKLLSLILVCMPLLCSAQNEWERPLSPAERLEQAKKAEAEAKKALKEEKKKAKEERKMQKRQGKDAGADKKEKKAVATTVKEKKPDVKREKIKDPKDEKYLADNAVPVVGDKVVYSLSLDVHGQRASDIYNRVYAYLDNLSQEENQIKSSIALVNKTEHIIAAKYNEWLDFSKSFIALDRTKFSYTIIAKCSDDHLDLTMERLSYNYEEDRETGFKSTAEKLITDEYAVNKKHTKLQPGTAKFRRKTIDRKDQIFNDIKSLFK